MNFRNAVERLGYAALRRVAALWIRPDVLPNPLELPLEDGQQLCYVLETGSLADLLALQIICRQQGLPTPLPRTALRIWSRSGHDPAIAAVSVIRRGKGLFLSRAHPQQQKLKALLASGDHSKLVFQPVAIYWGRSPDKEHSLLQLMFTEHWQVVGRSRKFMTTLLHGRHTLVRFSDLLALSSLSEEQQSEEKLARKLSRVLRVHFRQRRIASLGPDQSHKRTIIEKLLEHPDVVRLIDSNDEAELPKQTGWRKYLPKHRVPGQEAARRYAHEIAADMSFTTVRIMQRILQTLWNRLYDGVRFDGLDRLRTVVDGREIVYVPCHRSHIDYLLLSYALYMQGFSLPHIAAGLNLNMPVVGPVLRRGGAFFLRRSFSGNRLYTAVFRAYVQEIIVRGHSMEYFIEGGRSRSGRLLPPKAGMLAMTVQAYMRDTQRPIVFVPVYFGYERLVEGQSFISELSGAKKKKESLFGFLGSLQALRQEFGEVYANIGAPIELDALLDAHAADWREQVKGQDSSFKPDWLAGLIDSLGEEIMQRINRAASVTPISLLATALLSAPRQNLARDDLIQQLQLLLGILKELPYSAELSLPEHSAEEIIQHGEALGYIVTEAHALGEIILINPDQAVAMTYFRNNILHLFAVPAIVAACFVNRASLPLESIQELIKLSYPFLQTELFLRWSHDELAGLAEQTLQLYAQQQLIERDGRIYSREHSTDSAIVQLGLLAQNIMPALQRYYMATVLLSHQGDGQLKQSELEKLCELSAERLAIMHGLRSPDFFERNLFRSFLQTLRQFGWLRTDDDGLLHFEASLDSVEDQAGVLLDEPIRHSIRSITALSKPVEQ